jgi:hypothetical protein
VYVAVVFFLLPVALGRGWVNPGRPGVGRPLLRPLSDPRSRIGVLLTMAGFGVGVLLMGWAYLRSGGAYKTESGSLPPTDWPDTWARLFQTLGTLPASRVWVGGLAGAAVVGLVMVWANRRWSAWAVPTAGVLVFTGVAEWLVMGTRQWVALNLYHPRYLLGLVTAWQLAAAVLLVAPLAGWAAGRGRWVVFASVALALGGVVQTEYGPPSAAAVRRVYDERFGQYTADVLAAGADAVAGDYWTVWPAVFHINMVRHARGEPPVFGVADRGRPWRSRWVPPRPVVLVAVPHGQEEAVAAQSPGGTFSPFTPAGDFDTVAVFRSRPLP